MTSKIFLQKKKCFDKNNKFHKIFFLITHIKTCIYKIIIYVMFSYTNKIWVVL